MYPCLFILYFACKSEAKSSQNSLFGIRVSEEWITRDETDALKNQYRKKMHRYLLIFALIPFTTLFIPYFSICFSIWVFWLLAAIILFFVPYVQGNRTLSRLKHSRVHGAAPENATTSQNYTELKAVGTIPAVRWYDFVPSGTISLLLAAAGFYYLWERPDKLYSFVIAAFGASTLLFWLCAVCLGRMKSSVISTDSAVNVNYARAQKKLSRTLWVILAWCNTLLTAVIFFTTLLSPDTSDLPFFVLLGGGLITSLLGLGLIWYYAKRGDALWKSYQDKMDLDGEDEERAWIWGIFYYNPRDSHTFVNKRLGIGSTVNLATSGGKVNLLFTALILLIIPISCIWCMLEEFTPISLTLQDGTLYARHYKISYTIPEESIDELALLDEVPKSRRTNGTAADNLQKGTFRNKEDGKVQLFLNPQNHLFLRIEADGTIYYLSGYDDAETKDIYTRLIQ